MRGITAVVYALPDRYVCILFSSNDHDVLALTPNQYRNLRTALTLPFPHDVHLSLLLPPTTTFPATTQLPCGGEWSFAPQWCKKNTVPRMPLQSSIRWSGLQSDVLHLLETGVSTAEGLCATVGSHPCQFCEHLHPTPSWDGPPAYRPHGLQFRTCAIDCDDDGIVRHMLVVYATSTQWCFVLVSEECLSTDDSNSLSWPWLAAALETANVNVSTLRLMMSSPRTNEVTVWRLPPPRRMTMCCCAPTNKEKDAARALPRPPAPRADAGPRLVRRPTGERQQSALLRLGHILRTTGEPSASAPAAACPGDGGA